MISSVRISREWGRAVSRTIAVYTMLEIKSEGVDKGIEQVSAHTGIITNCTMCSCGWLLEISDLPIRFAPELLSRIREGVDVVVMMVRSILFIPFKIYSIISASN